MIIKINILLDSTKAEDTNKAKFSSMKTIGNSNKILFPKEFHKLTQRYSSITQLRIHQLSNSKMIQIYP